MRYFTDFLVIFILYIIFNGGCHAFSFDNCMNNIRRYYEDNTTLQECITFIMKCGNMDKVMISNNSNEILLDCEEKYNIVYELSPPGSDIHKFNTYLLSNIKTDYNTVVTPMAYCSIKTNNNLSLYSVCINRIFDRLHINDSMTGETIISRLFYGYQYECQNATRRIRSRFKVQMNNYEYHYIKDYANEYIQYKLPNNTPIIMVYCTINYPTKVFGSILLNANFHIDKEKSETCRRNVSAAFGNNNHFHDCIKYGMYCRNKFSIVSNYSSDIWAYFIYLAECIEYYYNHDNFVTVKKFCNDVLPVMRKMTRAERQACIDHINGILDIKNRTWKKNVFLSIFKGHKKILYSTTIRDVDMHAIEEGHDEHLYIEYNRDNTVVMPEVDLHNVDTFCDIKYTYYYGSSSGESSKNRRDKGKGKFNEDDNNQKTNYLRSTNLTIRN